MKPRDQRMESIDGNELRPKCIRRHRRCLGVILLGSAISMVVSSGCGATKASLATEQLLVSGAVDSTIAQVDFRPLTGKRVFLDTTYLNAGRQGMVGQNGQMIHNLVNSDYVISSLRQQMMAAGCLLKDNRADAEVICEARLGALATDGHSITFGIPANNALNSAASIFSNAPALPSIPELALAKREQKSGAAKIAVFAYSRETAEPIWQSGISQANSSARDMWVMGIGPMQSGTIYKGSQFAGSGFQREIEDSAPDALAKSDRNGISFRDPYLFAHSSDRQGPEAKQATAIQNGTETAVVTASATEKDTEKTQKR